MPSESRSVPWTGTDVFLFFALWFTAQIACGIVAGVVDNTKTNTQVQTVTTENADSGHPLAQLVTQSKDSLSVLFVAFSAAVVVAPFIEEFLFRLLFQGWLESKLAKLRIPHANGTAIVAVSLLFAMIHGGKGTSLDTHSLTMLFGTFIATNVLVLTIGIIYLKRKRLVQMTPYFFGRGRFFPPQFFTTAVWCFSALILIYGLTATLGKMYPNTNISPIPIFFFSLMLGTLFSKTQNLSYCILLHACLNGTSLLLVLFSR